MNNTMFQDLDFLHVLLDAVPSMLLVVDSDVRIFHVNTAAFRLIGPDRKNVKPGRKKKDRGKMAE